MINRKAKWLLGTSMGLMAASNVALAEDWSFSGLLREELAIKTGSDQNINNWAGNLFNGVKVQSVGLGAIPGTTFFTRPAAQKQDADINMLATRLELNLDGKLTENLAAHFKMRAMVDKVGSVEDAFKDKHLFDQSYGSSNSGGSLGKAGKDWMVDMPVAYFDYSNGPIWVRMGNQQIAWGEALFFRVADVANGLDFRRHSLFDVAAEEFSDKRVASLGIRGTWRANENAQFEGFVQQFRPSVIPGENAPYNFVPAQFVVDQRTGYEDVKDKFNVGFRFQGNVNDVGIQAFAVRRNNPDGVYRWTKAQVPGDAFAGTAFSLGGPGAAGGVYSGQEWFRYATSVRLDGVGGLAAALNEFPQTTALGGNVVAGACGAPNAGVGTVKLDHNSAACVLDTFFGFGALRGWLAREYPRESIYGFGLNTVFSGEPDSLTDQLIGRFELSYTPNKKFTNPTLSKNYLVKNETNFAFIAEKYHKFSDSFPATYMVLQWMHKSASDLFGRSDAGQNNTPGYSPTGTSGSNNVAFVVQQPSPTLEWRFDFAALTDLKGGLLLQPGAKWKLSKSLQLDIYGNYIRSSNHGKDFGEGLGYAREVFLRGTYYF